MTSQLDHDEDDGLPTPSEHVSARGDTAELEGFIREQYQALLFFLRRRCATLQDAEDAAQESMGRLLRYFHTEPPEAWKPLLYRIAMNVLTDTSRRTASHGGSKHVPLHDLELQSDEPNAEDQAARNQELFLLRNAILALPPKCQQVYLLKRLKGMTNAAIAKHCGISVKMVEKHTANALSFLKQRLGKSLSDSY